MANRKHVNDFKFLALAFVAAIILVAVVVSYPSSALCKQEPTAIIVDAETGKPVEGAIVLAQWLKPSDKAGWFEGGRMDLKKAIEVYADAAGKVFIEDFWGTYIVSEKPSLTVYKPGYILWHSRNDGTGKSVFNGAQVFTKKDNTIKLYKFETDSSKWLLQHPDIKYPHLEHQLYYDSCSLWCNSKEITLCAIFYNYEVDFRVKERKEKDNKNTINNDKK